MPRPVYIICSESVAEDRLTGLMSLFQVFERIEMTEVDKSSKADELLRQKVSMRVTAVWMRFPGDEACDFQHQLAFMMPPDDREHLAEVQSFKFSHPFQRFLAHFIADPFEGAGVLRVESRVRRVGDTQWLRQDFPILVEIPEQKALDQSR